MEFGCNTMCSPGLKTICSSLPAPALALILAFSLVACGRDDSEPKEISVYSARKEHLIKPLFDRYTERTGVRIRYLTDEAAPLLVRLETEGEHTPADLLLTVDAGNLWQAAERGLLAAVDSPALKRTIPAHLRDPDGRWFGLSLRARSIVYATERVQPGELQGYAELASLGWRGRLCLRTGEKVYNRSLVASLIYHLGEERTLEVLRGWVANLSLPPFASDTQAMEAVLAGNCDVTIVNSYYFGRLQTRYAEQGKTLPLAIFWPDKQGRPGVHVNVSGAGILRNAPYPQLAQNLLEWLASPEAQYLFAASNMEYPVHAEVTPVPQVAAWGGFRADRINVAELGRLQAKAVRLISRAGYR